LILSSNDDAQVAEQMCSAGARAYLVKGQFDPASLGQAIRSAIR
jgi:DNA-binding NarL/FixJ family response regulator